MLQTKCFLAHRCIFELNPCITSSFTHKLIGLTINAYSVGIICIRTRQQTDVEAYFTQNPLNGNSLARACKELS